jgi:hypothetical protein
MGGAKKKKKQQVQKTVPPATLAELQVIAANPAYSPSEAAALLNIAMAEFDISVDTDEVELYRDTRYAEYFLESRSSVVQLETIEISHPAFSKVYRLVRNAVGGLTAFVETGGSVFFEYYPMKLVPHHARDDLDFFLSITFGDLGEVLPKELDLVMTAPGGLSVKPTVKYRIYRSDDLSAPLYGPVRLEIESIAFDKEGATFDARAPGLNLTRTGEVYSLTRFPSLRGFV